MHKKIDIVVDIDEVLANLLPSFIEWHNSKYGTCVNPEECKTYRLWEILNTTKEDNLERIAKFFEDSHEKIMPVTDSIEGIEKLSRIAKLHLVTGRIEAQREQTKSWIEKYFNGKFSSIEFTSHYYSKNPVRKSDVCKKLGAKIIIEDDLVHAIDCAGNGIKAILLDKPWNQNVEHENIIRVKDWEQIAEIVEKIIREM